ncbi:hypothetical protein LSM04_008273 [Trypanosoma melophagium]|uniref:uncharacterized protein n=1 Tax=Trypanosoma melophagium TaxID=715481 RepID=UPI00351A0802|nr:hypothetical protein LSM04_008273 [Trypanosoma melophagium]
MRADIEDVAPAVPAKGEEFVICSAHHSRRLAKCCNCEPVRNADRVTIGYTYRCREGMECARAGERGSHVNQLQNGTNANSRNDTILQPSMSTEASTQAGAATGDSVASPDVEAASQQQPQQQNSRSGASRGPNRYYDLTNQRNTDATGTKKVCWNCGMEGHEKPECPNALCKTCHTTRNYHHICQDPHPSPFLILSSTLPFSEEMKFVECVSCHSLGHFDCSPRKVEKSSSCCFCGGMGHNAFDCRQRKDRVPDRWVTRIMANEQGLIRRGGYDGSPTFSSRSTPGNSSASYDRQTCGYNERSEFSRSDNNRYTYARENGHYGGDGNTGGCYASNSHTYGERRPNSRNTESNYKMSYSDTQTNWGSRRGEKRSRWDDADDSYRHGGKNNSHRNYDWGSERDSRNGRNYVDSYSVDGGRRRISESYHNHNHNHHHHHRDRQEEQHQHQHKHRRSSRHRRESDDDYNELF